MDKLRDLSAQLKILRDKNSLCSVCELGKPVLGYGYILSKYMIVGDFTSKDDDEYRVPFMGRAGLILDSLLKECKLTRQEVYITNIVKCFGGKKAKHIRNCKQWLFDEINLTQPSKIVTMGREASKALLGDYALHIAHKWNNITVIPTESVQELYQTSAKIEKVKGVFKRLEHI